MNKPKVIVVGGGLAGLTAAICLRAHGIAVTLLEKKSYPFHRVCGEYISQEVIPFLKRLNLYPEHIKTSTLTEFELSDIRGNTALLQLPLGGFGISRHAFDQYLYHTAIDRKVDIHCNSEVVDIRYQAVHDSFEIELKTGETLEADFVIGSYGKREKLDKALKRDFVKKRSPFIGVKEHIKIDYPSNRIGLYNFANGYCGVSQVEDAVVNICYLSRRENLRKYGSIQKMEENILYANPILNKIYEKAERLWEKPLVINEVSFEQKQSVENHILMAGDTAGLITPLCGNGMAMAIHSGFLAAEAINLLKEGNLTNRAEVELHYQNSWKNNFAKRLWVGRKTQNLFGNQSRSTLSVQLVKRLPNLAKGLIKATHGKSF